jgi:hypothetical protein
LALLESGLAKLCCHLRRRVVHELSVGAKHIPTRTALLLVWIPANAIAVLLGVLLRLRGAWRGRR